MSNPAPTLNQINAFNATIGTTIDFNIIGGTEVIRSNKIYIYDLSDNSLICTHLYVSTESIHELPPNTDSSIVYESGKSSADFTNNTQYYAQIQTFTDTNGTQGASGLSIAKLFWCLPTPTLTLGTIPTTISTTSYNVSATYTPNTSGSATNEIQEFQFNLYSAIGTLLQTSGVVLYGEGVDLSYNFSGLEVDSTYYVTLDVTTTQGMNVSAQSDTFTVSIDTPTMGSASVVNNGCDGYISVTSNLSSDYSHEYSVDAGEVMSFTTDSPNDIKELQVDFHPIQDGTPWMSQTPDTTPYLFRASPQLGHSYNSKIPTIVGGSVVGNQLVSASRASTSGSGLTFAKTGDYTLKIEGTRTSSSIVKVSENDISWKEGHKYLVMHNDPTFPNAYFYVGASSHGRTQNVTGNIGVIINCTGDEPSTYLGLYATTSITFNNEITTLLIDLTAMLGTSIADRAYAKEQAQAGSGIAWLKQYGFISDSYESYDTGALKSVKATAHKTYDADDNLIGNYPLGNVTLRGIPKVDANDNIYYDGDIYPPSGNGTEKYNEVDLGTLTYSYNTSGTYPVFIATIPDSNNNTPTGAFTIMCSKYVAVGANSLSGYQSMSADKTICKRSNNYTILIQDSGYTDPTAFRSAMSGVYLVYEKATPTAFTADPFTSPMLCDPSGTEEWVTSNGVPVGQSTTYADIYPISGWTDANVVVSPTLDAQAGTTYSISWQTEAGTVYGGTVDVVSGLLTATWGYIASYNGETLTGQWLSNLDEYAQGATPTTGAQVAYELATPQTYQLTPHQIQTLVGQNNLWHDTNGEMTIMYQLPITDLLVKRKDVSQVGSQWLTLHSVPITQASDMDFTYIDFLNQYGKTYQYALVPVLAQDQSGVVVQIEGGYTVSDNVNSIFDGVYIADQTNVERVKAGVGYGNVDMNQNVGAIVPIGSKYPIVVTNSQNQYHNGSIRGKIVPNNFYSNGNLSRIDMVNKRDELEQFLTNKRAKIIKDWNGKIWLVMILSNVACTFDDNYGMGMVEFSADWVEIGDPTTQQDLYNAGLINVGGV